MNNQISDSFQEVLNIADQAGFILLKYFKKNVVVEFKQDKFDPVTIADRESDDFIRESLHRLFPDDLILSEESKTIPDDYTKRVWMVDPLNGTKSFVKGSNTFAVVIGLVENGVPVFACVAIPAQNKVFCAEKEKGSFEKLGGTLKQIHTTSVHDIQQSRLITREPSGDIRPIEAVLNQIPFMERIEEGSGAKLCMIATGSAEAHINTNIRAGKWDIAAPQLILEEAGGIVTDLDGRAIDYKKVKVGLERSYVASANKELHDKIIGELLKLKV